MKNIRIAAAVCRSPVGDIDYNLRQTIHWVRQARAAEVDLICFPELNITGYTNQIDILDCAQTIPGPASGLLSELASQNGMVILAGMAEKEATGKAYASHLIFHPTGETAVFRKLHLAPNEKSCYRQGDAVSVFKSDKITFGVQLCYDAHFPELSTAMTAKGADILFMPHASPRGDATTKHQSWMRHLTARAYDNGVFVVACNQIGENGKGLVFPGNAVALDPSGNVIAKRLKNEEGLLIVDLKGSDLAAVRSHPMRHFFPNRRPELYS